jgi:hypothetical protein
VLDAAGRVRAAGSGERERTAAHSERVVVAGGGASGGAAAAAGGVPGGSERGRGARCVAGCRCERWRCAECGCAESCDGFACCCGACCSGARCCTVGLGGCRAPRGRNGAASRRRPLSVSRSSKPSLLNRHRWCSGVASVAEAAACGRPRSVGSFSKGENLVETSSRETTVLRLPFCVASVVADAASHSDGVLRSGSGKVPSPPSGSHHDRTTRVHRAQTHLMAGADW